MVQVCGTNLVPQKWNEYKFSEQDKAISQIITVLNNLIEKSPKTKTIGFRAGE